MIPTKAFAYFIAVPLLGLVGCATTSLQSDAREVRALLTDRAPAKVELPVPSETASWDEVDRDVGRLLAKPLTADDAVRVALLENRDLRANLFELGVWRGRAIQAGLLPNPEIDIDVRKSRHSADPLQMDVGLEYDISRLILTPSRRGVAESALAAERIRAAGDVLELAYRVRVAFFEAQGRKQQLDLRRRALESFQAGFATADELGRTGNIPEVDVANQRAQVEAARVAVAEAENAWLDAKAQLIAILGVTTQPEAATLDLAGPLELPEGELPARLRNESTAVETSLELAELKKRMETASRSVGVAKTEGALPHLSGGFHAERDERLWEIGGHLTIGIPIFDRAQGRQHSARAEFASLRERYVAAANAVRATHRVALTRVESTTRRARHYRDQVIPAREKALQAAVRQYNAMQTSVFQLLQVQREVTNAASSYVDTLVELWKARAALDTLASGRQRGLALAGAGSTTAMRNGGGAVEGDGH